MRTGTVGEKWCCVLGNEGTGISAQVRDVCRRHVRINMDSGVDSLSLPVATGILLNGLLERE
jgi:tRNA G18 (ribose-2'-O)-methylase SpoU